MRRGLHILLIVSAIVLTPSLCRAQTDSSGGGSSTSEFSLYYHWDRTDLDSTYLDNPEQMAAIRRHLAATPTIDSITIYAFASPEGVFEHNVMLADRRSKTARQFILDNLPEGHSLDPECIHLRPMNENWEGLYVELEANYHRRDRERVMAIMRDNSVGNDTKKWRLQQLDGGYTYDFIIRRHMPRLRVATWIGVHSPVQQAEPLNLEPLTAVGTYRLHDDGIAPEPVLPPIDKHTIVALKTNMLYDLGTVLNFSVEVPLSERFSLLYEHHCPWWLSDNNRYCLEYLSFGGEFRWWFAPRSEGAGPTRVKRDALVGHFLGVYGFGGKCDFQFNRSICYQADFFSAGLTYGYAMPLSKRLNIEFSLSVGYASIPYWHYNPSDDYEILFRDRERTGRWHWIGPTRVGVSLVVPLLVKRSANSKKAYRSW